MRKGSSVQVTGNLGYSCFWAFWFLLCVCACLGSGVGFFPSWCVQDLGLVGVPFLGIAPRALIFWGFTNLITWKITWKFIIQLFFSGDWGLFFLGNFSWLEAIYASLSGTGPVSMVIMHVWFLG